MIKFINYFGRMHDTGCDLEIVHKYKSARRI